MRIGVAPSAVVGVDKMRAGAAPLTYSVLFSRHSKAAPVPAKAPRMALVIDESIKAQIQHLANKHRRSTSGEIVVAIESWLQTHEAELADYQPAG